jgi:mannose-6-phosphate isomerase-like protein (cupin superfamily)
VKKFRPGFETEWRVLPGTRRSQAAEMTIPRGGKEGGPGNRHRGDQWMFVIAGTGSARVGRKTTRLKARSLLLIKAGEPHEIRNTGRAPLRTLNFYAPPVFDARQ